MAAAAAAQQQSARAAALGRPASGPLAAGEQRRPRNSAPAELRHDPRVPESSASTPANPPEDEEAEPQCTYNAERVVGNGTFGIVYSAHVMETDETVAIKKVFVDRRYRNRELQLWREMRHPNIVALKHAFYTSGDSPDELYLNMVMEFVPETVYCVMKRHGKTKRTMPRLLVQMYTYQACRALAYLHAGNVVHRDIKPQNLLVDVAKGHVLKLCDFGSAARLGVQGRANGSLVAYICSRYYRAPELIFGATNYTAAVDLWSIGCVLAEMIRGRPLFPGENGVDQLVEIVKVLGAPSKPQVLAMNPQYQNFTFPNVSACSWDTVISKTAPAGDADAVDLLAGLLRYEPERRRRPLEACARRFFDELRDEQTRLPDGQPVPSSLFELTQRELRLCPAGLYERLIPAWRAMQAPGSPAPNASEYASNRGLLGEEE